MRVLSLDVGGSSVKSGLVENGRLLTQVSRTPVRSKAAREIVLGEFRAVMSEYERVDGIAFAFPGPFDYEHGVCLVQGLEKYGHLYGVDLTESLGLRMPVRYFNDAEAALVGEARFGGGRAVRRVLGITLGTGLGSAFLVDGKRRSEGPGVPEEGWLYHCNFQEQMADDVFSIRGVLQRAARLGFRESEPKDIVEPQVWSEFGRDLGLFLKPFVDGFGAESVLVLGGLSGAFSSFGASLNEVLVGLARPGTLGSKAPVLGAAALFEDRS